jgi:hypothetical protein
MFFQRDYAVVNGDNIYGLQILEEQKVIDLIVSDVPTKVEGEWKRSITKRIKMAHSILSSKGSIAIFVSNQRAEEMKTVLDEQVGEKGYVLSCEWEDESLFIYGKANVYEEERVDEFLEEIRQLPRFDKKKEKKLGVNKVRDIDFVKAIINYFSEEDAEILDMYARSGMVGVAVWELNYEDFGQRKFTLINHDEDSTCSSLLYPHIYKQSLIYESPFDYVVLDEKLQ